jgi:glycerol-3-phosphate acyltransferase PlsY
LIAAAFAIGYFLGALPTASGIARIRGIDLRAGGSGNPGANNARRLGGLGLAAAVLFVEMAKGVAAVAITDAIGGDLWAVAGGIGAVSGNVFNVFYGFRGGKGLGITGGVVIAAWPTVLGPALAILIAAVAITRSSGAGTIVAVVGLNLLALLWVGQGWPTGWGVENDSQLIFLSLGISAIIWHKHWQDASFRRPRPV